MKLQELRDARQKEPFQPFSIRLTDGRVYPVELPEMVGMGRTFAIVATENDAFVVLRPALIDSLETQPNGKGAARRRRKS